MEENRVREDGKKGFNEAMPVGKGASGGMSKLQRYRYWLWSSSKTVSELRPQGKHTWRLMSIDHVLQKRIQAGGIEMLPSPSDICKRQ